VATVERVASTEEVAAAGITIPAHLVAAVAEAPFGAHPTSCYPDYAYDRSHLREYVEAAATAEGATEYLGRYVTGAPSEEGYLKLVGEESLERLRGWQTSTQAWQELFA
jgi:glutaconate CoA-transferase subunit A